MGFEEIVGSVSQHLREEILSSRVVHAYLLTGPAGTGKRTLADICARALFCQSSGSRPCGVCPACLQAMSGNHPDLIRLKPDKSIGVNDVRAMSGRVAAKPYEARGHVVIIEEADKMTAAAQNALLKTLEEPPGEDVFFLTADSMMALLPTIVSRCRVIRVSPLPWDQARQALVSRGIPQDRAALLARLCQGSVGQALARNGDTAWWALRDKVISALSHLREKQDVGVAAMPLVEKKEKKDKDDKDSKKESKKEKRDTAGDVMDILELCARDKMSLDDGDGFVMQPDVEDKIASLPIVGSKMLEAVMEARRMLASNVSFQATLEMLFFKMTGGQ